MCCSKLISGERLYDAWLQHIGWLGLASPTRRTRRLFQLPMCPIYLRSNPKFSNDIFFTHRGDVRARTRMCVPGMTQKYGSCLVNLLPGISLFVCSFVCFQQHEIYNNIGRDFCGQKQTISRSLRCKDPPSLPPSLPLGHNHSYYITYQVFILMDRTLVVFCDDAARRSFETIYVLNVRKS